MAPTVLFSYGELAGALSSTVTVTDGGTPVHADALAINSAGTLFAYKLETTITPLVGGGVSADVTASRLVTLNSATGAVASTIGTTLSGRDMRGAAFGPGGKLWGIDATGDALLDVDPATGAVNTAIGLTLGGNPFDLSTVSDIAIRSSGVAIVEDFDDFYQVNLTTGAMSLLFTLSDPFGTGTQFSGAAFSNGAGNGVMFLYEVGGGEDLRRVDLNAGNAQTLQISNIVPFLGGQVFNAGRGDLAAQVTFVVAAPEPGALAAFGFGLAFLGMGRLFRR